MLLSKKIIFVLSLLTISCLLYADPPEQINFQQLTNGQLNQLDGQTIQIRGFLYQTNDKQQILAAEPNLKTCCIASKTTAARQIYLTNLVEVPSAGMAVKIQGKFIVQRKLPDEIRYALQEATLVTEETNPTLWWVLGAIVLALGIWIYVRIMKTKFKNSTGLK